ncbi:hypothetical protein JCM12294_44630 [Desulfocicer niacini]
MKPDSPGGRLTASMEPASSLGENVLHGFNKPLILFSTLLSIMAPVVPTR